MTTALCVDNQRINRVQSLLGYDGKSINPLLLLNAHQPEVREICRELKIIFTIILPLIEAKRRIILQA